MPRSNPSADPTGGKRGRSSKRPPIATIVLLVVFLLTILAFITLRQQQTTEDQKLRLLAGLATQVETALPDRAGRMIDVIQGRCKPPEVQRYLGELPDLQLIQQNFENPPTPPGDQGDSTRLLAVGGEIYLGYFGPAFLGPSSLGEDSTDAQAEDDCLRRDEAQFLAKVDLSRIVEPIIIPEAFDAMLIADKDGEVLFQRGSRELRLTDVSHLLDQIDESAGFLGIGRFLAGAPEQDSTPGPRGRYTVVDSVQVANSDYRLFLQPVDVGLPALRGEQAPPVTRWMAIGLVSEERMLSASFTTSPLLLFLLVAVFPAALVSWPFLKLRYISPRQRFHRLDAVALVFATLFGTSLATFVLLDGLFVSRLNSEVDQHLGDLSDSLRDDFRFELLDAYHQLRVARDDESFVIEETPGGDGQELDLMRRELEKHFALPASCTGDEIVAVESREERMPLIYPYFHSLFRIAPDGGQHSKLSLRRYALLTNPVPRRDYFTRIYDSEAGDVATRFPHRGQRRFELQLDDGECLDYLGSSTEFPHRSEDLCEVGVRATFSPLRSMTSGEDLLVVSIPDESFHSGGDDAGRRPVHVLYGKPISVGFPVLPEAYGFAVVDEDGRVLFHSDPRRSLNENFVKAVDRSALLTSLIDSQRSAHLVADYWGQRHRMHVAPMQDLPWSLVVFRHSRDLRLRNFELTYDFLNPFLLYTLMLNLFVMAIILLLHRRHLHKFLWPSARFGSSYRLLMLVSLAIILVTACVVAVVDQGWVPAPLLVWFAVLFPFIALSVASLVLACARQLSTRDGHGKLREERVELWLHLERLLIVPAIILALFALLPWLGHWFGSRPMPSLVPAALVAAVAVWVATWRNRRHSFLGRRRMNAYISTLACLIFVLAVVPVVMLFEAAASRQVQLLVQETQIQQAEALQERAERLQDARDEIECRALFTDHQTVVRSLRDNYLAAIFSTEIPPEVPDLDGRAARAGLWHHECAEVTDRSGDESDGDGEKVATPGRAQRLVSARPFPLNDLSSATTGVDLSRHPRHGCSWWADGVDEDGVPQLTGRLDSVWSEATVLRSSLFEPLSFSQLGVPHVVVFAIACLLVFLMPRWLSRVIARKVLLVPLVSVERGRIRQILQQAAQPEAKAAGDDKKRTRKILLVTSVPDLALDSLVEEDLAKESQAEEAPAGDGRGEKKPKDLSFDDLFEIYTLERLVDEYKEKVAAKQQQKQRAQFRKGARQQGARSVLLVRFSPELGADKESRRRSEEQIEALKYVSEDEHRTLVILSRFSIHALHEEAARLERESGGGVDRTLVRRWVAFLGSFVVRYGKDVTRQQESRFRRAVIEKAETVTKDLEAPSEIREILRLLEVVYRDCSLTRHLQDVGLEVLSEMDSEINFQSATETQVLNQIAFLARPYYQAIWENCSTDEKVVLAQLALDGLVNPGNFGWVLDLMQKGLVRREDYDTGLELSSAGPWQRLAERRKSGRFGWLASIWPSRPVPSTALRLMNRSFARFVRQQVERVQLLEWEEEEGTSTWSVLRWLLPIPLLLLGGFLFITQRDAVSNMIGVLVAVASLTPTLVTLFDHFRHMADRRALDERRAADGD